MPTLEIVTILIIATLSIFFSPFLGFFLSSALILIMAYSKVEKEKQKLKQKFDEMEQRLHKLEEVEQ